MRTGTNHFTDAAAARAYYRPYGFNAADVQRKLDAGEIHLGAPEKKDGQKLGIDNDGRYFLEEINPWK